jgi:DNA-directed RNA polymerase subunit RPC12/RpoP
MPVTEYKCHVCGKAFMIERNLQLHLKLHLGQKDYACTICEKSYYTKSGLQVSTYTLPQPPEGSFLKQLGAKLAPTEKLAPN